MTPRYQKWRVAGYERDVLDYHDDGSRSLLGTELVVVIAEPTGWTWQLVMKGEDIAVLTVRHRRGLPVDMTVLRGTPLDDLARIAAIFLTRAKELWEDGLPEALSLTVAELTPGEVRRSLDRKPTDEEFARAWHETGPRLPDGSPRRKALAARFAVSPYTIDKWTSRARDRGLIPPAKTGRGNRAWPPRPADDDNNNNNNKEQ